MGAVMEPRFIVFSCGYNCQDYVTEHLASIEFQTYKNFKHILIDDASIDNTRIIINNFYTSNNIDTYICIRNLTNKGWLNNSVDYLYPENNDVIVLVDMDDRLSHLHVLEDLALIYEKENPWMTYGSFRWHEKNVIEGKKYPRDIDYRIAPWQAVHLQSFRNFLWDNINKNDFILPNGNYAKSTYDMPIMFSILEMTPYTKQRFIPEVLYIYNDGNPLNVGRIRKQEQINNERYFRSLPKYKELEVG